MNSEQRLDQQAKIFQYIKSALNEGTIHNYSKDYLTIYLRYQQAYLIRENNICNTLLTLDREGTKTCQLNLKKRWKGDEFLISLHAGIETHLMVLIAWRVLLLKVASNTPSSSQLQI